MTPEIKEFKEFLASQGYPETLISVECAWVSQQEQGTATRIMAITKKLQEYINERRQQDTRSNTH